MASFLFNRAAGTREGCLACAPQFIPDYLILMGVTKYFHYLSVYVIFFKFPFLFSFLI